MVERASEGVSISAGAVMQAAQMRLAKQTQELLEITARNVDLEQQLAAALAEIQELQAAQPQPEVDPLRRKLPQQVTPE